MANGGAPLLGNRGLTANGSPGAMLFGVEASESDDLGGRVKIGQGAELAQELAGGQVANARDGDEQVALTFEVRMVVNVVGHELFELLNLPVQKGNLVLQLSDHHLSRRTSAEAV